MSVAPERALPEIPLEELVHEDGRRAFLADDRPSRSRIRRRGWLMRRMLLLADVVGLLCAFLVAQLVFGAGDATSTDGETLVFVASIPAWIVMAKSYGLYARDEERTDHSTVDEVLAIFHKVTVGSWLFLVFTWVTAAAHPDIWRLGFFWLTAVVAISGGRAAARAICRRRTAYVQNAVIIGAGDVGQLIGRKLLQHPEYGINLVGFVDDRPKERRPDLAHLTLLGGPEQLPDIVGLFDVERVIIAFSNESHEEVLGLIRSLKTVDVQIDVVPRLFDIVGPTVEMHTVEGLPLLGLRPMRLSRSSRLTKRAADAVISGIGLVVLAPLFALIAAAIKLDSPGPVFFRQIRMGCEDETFGMYKFRTMSIDADRRKHEVAHLNRYTKNGSDPRMFKAENDPRVTRVGAFLRRYSLDELPQLLNVFRGEMSLVGPRPLILPEDEHVIDWARNRLDLRPGITGLWQVLGRNDIPFEEMTKLDYLYVMNWSFVGDLKLLARTFPAVLKRRSAY